VKAAARLNEIMRGWANEILNSISLRNFSRWREEIYVELNEVLRGWKMEGGVGFNWRVKEKFAFYGGAR
jgi:hypothetical protein